LAIVVLPVAAFSVLGFLVMLGDREWSRNFGVSSGYEAAVEGALLALDAKHPERLRRDFTTFSTNPDEQAYAPCPLSVAAADGALRSARRADHLCVVTAGPGAPDTTCPFSRCVQVVLNDETLRDSDTLVMLQRTLHSRADVCGYARMYGWNPEFNANWLGCSGGGAPKMQLLLVGVERAPHPCAKVVAGRTGDGGTAYRYDCTLRIRRVIRAL
jgi:hypothetical protein